MVNNNGNDKNMKSEFPKRLIDYTPVLTTTISDSTKVRKKRLRNYIKLNTEVTDLILSTVFVTPLVVGQWRGTWMLTEYYGISWWMCLLTGGILHVIFAVLKDILQNYFSNKKKECLMSLVILFLFSRVYTWLFGIACVCHWHGSWMMVEEYSGREIGSVIAVTLLSLAVLSAMKTLRNINTSPFSTCIDDLETGFAFPTLFRTSVSTSIWQVLAEQSQPHSTAKVSIVPSSLA